MRTEFIYVSNEVAIDEYMEKAAKWLRSIQLGEVLEDGRCLADELSEAEQQEVSNYIYMVAYDEMKATVGKHCVYKCNFESYVEDFFNNFMIVIMKRLHTFNQASRLKDSTKKYKFSTFLDELSKDAVRITYAQKRGVPEYVEQRIQNVHKAIRKINEEKELYFDDIPYELISAEVTRRMTTRTVTSIMNIDARKMSIDEVTEKEGREQALFGMAHLETDIFNVLDVDTEKLFDAFFSKLRDVEKFFVLVHVGCDPRYDKMTASQLSMDEMFVRIVEEDTKFCKNISVGTVFVERPERRSVKDVQPQTYQDVKYVNENLIKYQRGQAKKVLLTLKNGLDFSDISGGCGVAYFMKQWKDLKEKYEIL